MENFIFISHAFQDRKLAEIISDYLTKITLRQFKIWYSSDESGFGGIKAGSLWFDEILKQLEKSKVVIALITPNSINKPWIYFESGVGQAIQNCQIIPILIGISKFSQVPAPLSLYQSFQITDYKALKRFTEKLLANYNIPFEEDLSKDFVQKTISKIIDESQLVFNENDETSDLSLLELKKYFENRFNDLKSSIANPTKSEFDYFQEVGIEINMGGTVTKQYLEVDETDTIEDIVTRIYFMINEKVKPYTYLEEWAIREKQYNFLLVIKEIQDKIPAKLLFNEKFSWEVIHLETPYNIKERNDLVHQANRV